MDLVYGTEALPPTRPTPSLICQRALLPVCTYIAWHITPYFGRTHVYCVEQALFALACAIHSNTPSTRLFSSVERVFLLFCSDDLAAIGWGTHYRHCENATQPK